MRRFHFRLDRLLEIRKYHEREWELKLAEITGICINLKNEIEKHIQEHADSFYSRKLMGVLDIAALQWNEIYQERLLREIDRLRDILKEKEKIRSETNNKYLEASKKRKVLDKLKEKQQQKNYKNQLLEEIKAVDDINMMNFES